MSVSPVYLGPHMPSGQTITPADVGRRVTAVRGIDWNWRTPCEDTIVVRVQTVQPWGAQVVIASESVGFTLCFDPADIRLLPLNLHI